MTVLLHRHAGELAAADDDHLASVLFQLLDERDEVAVAADDDEGVDVIVGEGHLEGVERHGDVGAVLVAARRHVALHHADGVLGEEPAVVADALPVAIGNLGDDLAALFDGLEDEADVELAADGGFDADLDVVEVDEYGNAVTCFCRCHVPSAGAERWLTVGRGVRGWSDTGPSFVFANLLASGASGSSKKSGAISAALP